MDVFVSPVMPYAALSIAGVLLALLGLHGLRRGRSLSFSSAGAGRRVLDGRFARLPGSARWLLAQLAAVSLAGIPLLAALAGAENRRMPGLLVAAGVYLAVGVMLPRRPAARAARGRVLIRRLTPGFASYVRVALAGYDSPAALLERYVARRVPRLAPLQDVVTDALALMRARRLRPFEALRLVAHRAGALELCDVAETLAQAESEGLDPQLALEAHEQTLRAILDDEFRRALKRRTMYLLVLVALSLVIGVLGNLLFVFFAGSDLALYG